MLDAYRVTEAFSRLNVPVFLARETATSSGPLLTLHTTERRGLTLIERRATDALRRDGIDARCRVVSHSKRSLGRARSLETLSRRFGTGQVVYDPTKFIERCEAVLDCAQRVRAALGDEAQTIALDAKRRTLYVIVREDGDAQDRAEIVAKVGRLMTEWQAAHRFTLAVRIGSQLPRDGKLVTVDNIGTVRSLRALVFGRKAILRNAIAMGAAALFGASMAVPAAAREPAVSTPNFTFMAKAGSAFDEGEGDVGFKAAYPLGQSFGVQGEAGVGTDEYYGFGGHVFWRDPSWAMIGGFASFESLDDVDMTRYGVEAELYVERFTIGGRVGGQSGDVEDSAFGRVDVSFYATPNFVLKAGGEFNEDDDLGRAGVEWAPAMETAPTLSVFADGEWSDDEDSIMAGLKIHFGAPGVSLINRDRREDPSWLIFNRLQLQGYNGPVINGPPA